MSSRDTVSVGGGSAGAPIQTTHRGYLGSRQDQIKAVQSDVFRGNGTTISRERAEEMLDSVRYYSGEPGYTFIRGAYNNPGAHPSDAAALASLDDYLRRSPKWKGTIYRGIHVTPSIVEKILADGIVDMLGPSSWSSSAGVAEKFSRGLFEQLPDGQNVVFVLPENRSGVSVTHIATFNGTEDEVTAPSGITYVVERVEQVVKAGVEYILIYVFES